MLIAIVGKKYEAREKLRKEAAGSLPVALCERSDTLSSELLEKAAGASLFGGESAYLVRGILEEGAEEFLSLLPELVRSPHLFILEEEGLLKAGKDAVIEAGGKVLEAKKEAAAEQSFNLFALADSLGSRDKKKLWLLLVRALRGGYEPEEIAGVLHWGARSMLAAVNAKSMESTGMKSFTYTKAKRQAANFTPKELASLSRHLVALYHEGHRGDDMALLLERLALSL